MGTGIVGVVPGADISVIRCVIAATVGLNVGSFLNVVIYRVPRRMSVVTPRSHCPGCGTEIAGYDNIPVLSWMLLLGRCRHCRMRISPRYVWVEASTGLAWALLGWFDANITFLVASAMAAAGGIAVAGIAFDRLPPPRIVLAVMTGGVLVMAATVAIEGHDRALIVGIVSSAASSALAFLVDARTRGGAVVPMTLLGAAAGFGSVTGAVIIISIEVAVSITLRVFGPQNAYLVGRSTAALSAGGLVAMVLSVALA